MSSQILPQTKRPLTIALSKGRILEETLSLLERAGFAPDEDLRATRQLMINGAGGVRFLLIRAADVCTYVEHGAADMGIAGRDLLLEHRPRIYEPLDLGIGRCRMCIAGPAEFIAGGKPEAGSRIRVATKYDYLAQRHYLALGIQADIIHLYGSMELAPLVGMADRIVDLVSTGNTLRANGLVEEEALYDISSRLVVNPASLATRKTLVEPAIDAFTRAVTCGENSVEKRA